MSVRESLGVAAQFAARASASPDSVAVIDGARVVSYGALAEEAGRVSAALVARGAGRGTRVAVSLPPGVDQIAVVLGVVAAGASYVPVDPDEPWARRSFILDDASPTLVVVQDGAGSSEGQVTLRDLVRGTGAVPLAPVAVGAREPIYVMYTSGTTGRPKGVELTHAGVSNLLRALVDRAELADVETVLYRTRLAFDASVPELLLPLAYGKTVVVAADGRDITLILDLIQRHHVHMVTMVPSLASALVGSGVPLGALSSVTRWFSVGEELPARTARDLLVRAADVGSELRLYNMYGPTEACVFLSGGRVRQQDVATGVERVSLGAPLAGYRVHVLVPGTVDRAEPGGLGEICVAGPGVGLGYLGDVESTAFTTEPGTGAPMYRTGDLGRLAIDGTLEYHGRTDDQVKIRGYRVELGEVDAWLASLAGVVDAGSAVVRHGERDTLVAAVVVSDEGLTPARVASNLARLVPAHMVPTTVVTLDALPTTVNGKLDRGVIAARVRDDYAEAERAAAAVALEDDLESDEGLLVDVLLAAAGGAQTPSAVGPGTTPHDLGVDSLAAVLAVGMLRARGRSLTVRELLEGRSIRDLAGMLRRLEEAAAPWADDGWEERSWQPGLSDEGERIDAVAPLAPIQEGILAATTRDTTGTGHIVQQVYDVVPGRLDVQRLRDALRLVSARHAALRTRLRSDARGRYEQVVVSTAEPCLTSLQGISPAEAEAFIVRDRRAPFDLESAPLVRLAWLTGDNVSLLVVTYHHIILDGQAQDLLVEAILAEHDALASSTPQARAPSLDVVRQDVTAHTSRLRALAHQATVLTSATVEYYRDLLSGLEPDRSLALYTSRCADGSPIGTVTVAVPTSVLEGAVRLAREAHATVSTVLETAWSTVLRQFSGTDDIVYAKAVTRRDLPVAGTATAIGPLFNTVPVRARAQAGETVIDLVRRTYAQSAATAEHATLRLDDAMRAADQPPGQVQSLYQFERHSPSRAAVESAGLSARAGSTEQAGFDLSLLAAHSFGGLSLTGLYDGLAMGAADVEFLLQRVVEVLRAMGERPRDPADALPAVIVGEEEVLAEDAFDLTPTPYPRVEEVFDRVVARDPDRCALRQGYRSITYRELDRAAERCAATLRDLGVNPGDRVGVAAGPAMEPIVALLGILRLGAAYVPVDLGAGPDYLDHVVRSSGLQFLVTGPAVAEHAVLTRARVLGVALARVDLAEDGPVPRVDRPVGLDANASAYVIYTSGTTSSPKGVSVPHCGVTRLVMEPGYVRLHGEQVVLQTVAMTFDVSTLEIWGVLLQGATLVLTDHETIVDTALLKAAIRREQVSWMWLTTSLFNMHAEADATVWDGMDTVVVGGERLSERHVRAFFASNSVTVLINGYGPTEATTLATSHVIERDFRTIPIGRPIPRTGAHVVAQCRVVGCLLPGELWLTGDGVAIEYVADPRGTEAAFVESPAGDGRAYRTRDIVRRNLDGTLEYLGRVDDQVKIRGHRVETTEIAAAISAQAEVAQSAVLVRTAEHGGAQLVGFVVPEDAVTESELRARLAHVLPSFALPARIHVVGHLPLTSSGKIDRRALLDVAADREKREDTPAVARSADVGASEYLRGLYALACGTEAVGPDSDFFELGGDSLAAMQVVNMLRQDGIDVQLREVLAAPTPRLLGALLGSRLTGRRVPRCEPQAGDEAPEEPLTATAPLWPTVRGAVAAQLQDPESRSYNIPFGLIIDGRIDVDWLRHRLDAIVRRHPMLRTGFVVGEADDVEAGALALRQVTRVAADVPDVEVEEISEPSTRLGTQEAEAALRAFARSFDLSAPPLLRAGVVHGAAQDLLVLDAHHSVFDATSLNLLLTMLAEGAEPTGAVQHRTAGPASASEEDVQYWRDRLALLPSPVGLRLSWDAADTSLGTVGAELRADVALAARARAAGLGITEYAVFAGAAAVLVQRYTLAEDVVLGMPVDLRANSGGSDTIGMWVNTLPLPLHVSDELTVDALLAGAAHEVLAGLDHAHVPLDVIQSAVQADRRDERVDLVRTILAYRRGGRTVVDVQGRTARLVGPLSIEAKVDLEITVDVEQDTYRIGLEYRRSAVDDDTAVGMLDHFAALVADIAMVAGDTVVAAIADGQGGSPP